MTPQKGGYTTPAPALDLTTSLGGDFPAKSSPGEPPPLPRNGESAPAMLVIAWVCVRGVCQRIDSHGAQTARVDRTPLYRCRKTMGSMFGPGRGDALPGGGLQKDGGCPRTTALGPRSPRHVAPRRTWNACVCPAASHSPAPTHPQRRGAHSPAGSPLPQAGRALRGEKMNVFQKCTFAKRLRAHMFNHGWWRSAVRFD